jgi:hypothetical protein
MKTTHEKLLISLLALGLTSSAGLYGQSFGTGFGFANIGGDLNQQTPFNEDADQDGIFDINEDVADIGVLNNGGTGPVDAQGNPTFLVNGVNGATVTEGPLLNEFVDQVDYDGDGVIDATAAIANANLYNEDFDGDGQFSFSEEVGLPDGLFSRGEDTDGDGNLDVDEATAGNGDNILNNGGTGPLDNNGNPTLLNGEGALLSEFADGVDYDGDGVIDATAAIANANLYNEDLDGDGSLDTQAEDINGNGILDTDRRSFISSLDGNNNEQNIDFLVPDGLYVNGEIVATQNYVDAADARLQGQIDTNARGIANNRRDIDSNTRGIAMVAALQTTTVLPGMTQALDLSAAHFEGETGLAINYSRRINDNVQINFGAATTSDGDENVVKAGIGWQW